MKSKVRHYLGVFALLCVVFASAGASWAYSISGVVSYSGSKTGRVYLSVYNQYGSTGFGTSISTPGAYTIRGLPSGTYTVKAFMDTIGFGVTNALHPQGEASATVGVTDQTGVNVSLSEMLTPPLSPPLGVEVTPGDGGALVMWKGPSDNNGAEIAQSYNLYWSTDSNVLSTYTTLGGSKTGIPAHDDGHQFLSGLGNGSKFYFAVTTLIGTSESAAATSAQITIGAPSGGTTASGTVTLNGATPTGPLFVGINPPNGGPVAFTIVPTPVSPQAFTVSGVPAGNYTVFAFIDNNNNGRIDLGDLRNPENREQHITVSSTPLSDVNFQLTGANAAINTTTIHGTNNGADWYNLRFDANSILKLPVNLVMNGGPNISGPLDLGLSQWGGFQYTASLLPRPVVGQNYSFTVGYSDTTSETLNSPVTGVLDDFAAPVSPKGVVAAPPPASVIFSWNQPNPAPGYPYTYSFWLNLPNGWFNSDPYYNMPASTLSVNPGSDEFSAQAGVNYDWTVALQDANGNSSQTSTNFTYGSGSISGKVTSDGTNGIAGTYVVLLDSFSNSPLNGFPAIPTDSGSGSYTINNIPSGNYRLYFSAGPGYQAQVYNAGSILTITVDSPLTGIDAVLFPAPGSGTIAGFVFNAATRQPVSNATVQLLDTSNNMVGGVQSVLTTSDGGFQLSAIPAGTYKLRISATDYQTSTPITVYNVVSGQMTPASISLPPIPATVIYTSKVTDSSSVALSGAQIDVYAGNVILNATNTDSNGMFSISVPSQIQFYLRISKAGFVTTTTSMMSFNKDTDSSDRPYSLQTTSEVAAWYTTPQTANTGTIVGRVASAANPLMTLPGVTLSASDGTGTPYTICYNNGTVNCSLTATNANGRFYILNVPAGKQVTVTASKSGYNGGSRSFLVAADSVSQGRIGMATSSSSFTYTGKVVDASAVAVTGATVTVFSEGSLTGGTNIGQVSTDANGIFTAADLVPGMTYYLRLSGTGYIDTYSTNMGMSANLDRTARPYTLYPTAQFSDAAWQFSTSSGLIFGSIKDNLTNLPLGGVVLSAVDATTAAVYPVVYDDGSIPVSTSTATSTSAAHGGRFFVPNVPANSKVTITVTSVPAGYNTPNNPTTYHVFAANKLSMGSIRPGPTSSVSATGSVINLLNLPIAGAKVSAYALPGWTLLNNPALTDSNGKFSLGVPVNAPFALEIITDGYRSAYSQDLQLNQNSTLANFILMSTADYSSIGWPLTADKTFIRGMAVDTLGQPQSGVTMTASSTPSHSYTVQYANDAFALVTGGSTFANGIFALADAVSSDSNITLTASKAGKTFYNPSFSHMVPGTDSLGMAFEYSATAGTLSATPSAVNFGNVNLGSGTTTQEITLTNNGPGTVTITSAGPTGNTSELDIQPGGANPCPSTQPVTFPPGTCTLVATFTPTTAGSKTTTLTINSDATNPVFTLTLTGTGVATAPGAPTNISVTPWDGQATVYFSAPASDGGSAIQSYTVTANPGNIQFTGSASPITVTGLTNGTLYTFTVTATNTAGTGSPSTGFNATPIFAPVRVGTTGYTGVYQAYTAMTSGDTILITAGSFTIQSPPAILDLTKVATLSGGWNSDYTPNPSGYTTFVGRMNITNGKVIFRNIRVKAP